MINLRIIFAPRPVREIAIQCPQCRCWFKGQEIAMEHISFESQIYRTRFVCPMCSMRIEPDAENGETKITECKTAAEVYDGCRQRVTIWQ